jgi:universal stress protein A
MDAKKILVPTDFSDCSAEALEYATALARESGGTLLIVHAAEPLVPFGGDEMYYGLLEADYHEIQRLLNELQPTDPAVTFQRRLLRGNTEAAKKIVNYAKAENVDLIVMGTHGRTGLKRLLLGSVAEAVVRHAPCPVTLVKQGSAKHATV